MSRIGKEPVAIPAGVTVKVDGQKVTVKGKLGELAYVMHDGITAKVEGGKVVVSCADDKLLGNFHGLARALIHNNVVGVSEGYKKQLTIEGTGFKAALQGKTLALSLGFASPKLYARRPAGDRHGHRQGQGWRVRRAHPRVLSRRALQGQGRQISRRAHSPQTGQEGGLI